MFRHVRMRIRCIKNTICSILIQNRYDMTDIHRAEELNIFLVPGVSDINGGIMSIFSLCAHSRLVLSNVKSILVTYPGFNTHSCNNFFKNDEQIYRWSQIINKNNTLRKLTLHIPEYYIPNFCRSLTKRDRDILTGINDLHINIMNQNIELMPDQNEVNKLFLLTKNITQTTAHERYTNQYYADLYKIPTHRFGTYEDYSCYPTFDWKDKEKIIVVSPDKNEHKKSILLQLSHNFPDFKFITIHNMPFVKYMELAGKSFFSITFGEGLDGYFSFPPVVNSLSFSVYNEEFFPNKTWLELPTVFCSYQEMADNITEKMTYYLNNKNAYYEDIDLLNKKINSIRLTREQYLDNLKRFYCGQYDFYPAN